jgi:hypothetical protein
VSVAKPCCRATAASRPSCRDGRSVEKNGMETSRSAGLGAGGIATLASSGECGPAAYCLHDRAARGWHLPVVRQGSAGSPFWPHLEPVVLRWRSRGVVPVLLMAGFTVFADPVPFRLRASAPDAMAMASDAAPTSPRTFVDPLTLHRLRFQSVDVCPGDLLPPRPNRARLTFASRSAWVDGNCLVAPLLAHDSPLAQPRRTAGALDGGLHRAGRPGSARGARVGPRRKGHGERCRTHEP